MSVAIMAQVWNLTLPPHEKLVLLAHADHANDEGIAWPTRDRIAEKTGYSEHRIKSINRSLRKQGKLVIVEPAPGRGTAPIHMICPDGVEGGLPLWEGDRPQPPSQQKGIASDPLPGNKGIVADPLPVQKGVASDPRRGLPTTPQPSVEPSSLIQTSEPELLTADAANGMSPSLVANRMVGRWIEEQPVKPCEKEIKKQYRCALRLAESRPLEHLVLMWHGMGAMFPYSEEGWDFFDMERKASKALANGAAAQHGTSLGDARESAALLNAIRNGA